MTPYDLAHLALVLPSVLILVTGGLIALVMATRGHRGASAVAAAAGMALMAELSVLALWQLEHASGLQIEYQSAPYLVMLGVSMALTAIGPTLLALSSLWGRRDA